MLAGLRTRTNLGLLAQQPVELCKQFVGRRRPQRSPEVPICPARCRATSYASPDRMTALFPTSSRGDVRVELREPDATVHDAGRSFVRPNADKKSYSYILAAHSSRRSFRRRCRSCRLGRAGSSNRGGAVTMSAGNRRLREELLAVSKWSGRRESNPRSQFGRLGLYH
jgi:hypothetical protein